MGQKYEEKKLTDTSASFQKALGTFTPKNWPPKNVCRGPKQCFSSFTNLLCQQSERKKEKERESERAGERETREGEDRKDGEAASRKK